MKIATVAPLLLVVMSAGLAFGQVDPSPYALEFVNGYENGTGPDDIYFDSRPIIRGEVSVPASAVGEDFPAIAVTWRLWDASNAITDFEPDASQLFYFDGPGGRWATIESIHSSWGFGSGDFTLQPESVKAGGVEIPWYIPPVHFGQTLHVVPEPSGLFLLVPVLGWLASFRKGSRHGR